MWQIKKKSSSSCKANYEPLNGGNRDIRRHVLMERIWGIRIWLLAFATVALVCFNMNHIQKYMQAPNHRPTESPLEKSTNPHTYLPHEYIQLLSSNSALNLFILEPYILTKLIGFSESQFDDFRWRFNLPQEFDWWRNSLTVGMFADNEQSHNLSHLNLGHFVKKAQILGPCGPFDTNSNTNNTHILHVFYRANSSSIGIPLHLHLVVLYRVKQFLWVGPITPSVLFALNNQNERNPNRTFNVHYGKQPQIFDPFNLTQIGGGDILGPDDMPHLLSQLPTSRYIHCLPEKTEKWFRENNQTINQDKVESSVLGIVGMKSLMRQMQMEFWIACGTLLGWYRQCHITPYTTDTDFASWSKYIHARDLTQVLRTEARHHALYLYNRFGERMRSLEYSFATNTKWQKLDLFFIYQNRTHFLLPFHVMPRFGYSVYPKYELCSVELLGYKLLAPCEPEKIIVTEYGPNWTKPVSTWNYYTAPRNVGPLRRFSFNVTQHEQFDQ